VLDLEAAALGDDRTRICARLGPDPHVWTFLVFLYAATGLPSFFASMFGLAQLAMGEPAWGLAALPAVLVAWAAIYSSSFVGRGLGALQIHQLLAVVEATLSVDAEEVE
jgi:TM2 domain-containing membrane protein YozV